MPGIVLAAPAVVPPPTGDAAWTHMRHTWTGPDGTEWDLCSPDSGVRLMAGVRGLTSPEHARFASAAAGVPGSRWDGYRTLEREVFWPLKVWSDAGSTAWVEYDRAFWDSLPPDRPGVWRVEQADGNWRELAVRFGAESTAFDTDPSLVGWARYGVDLVAEWPYWQGPAQSYRWEASDPVDFFGGSGGPPFYISSGFTLGSALVRNPGDVDAWPTWTLTGPFDSASMTVGTSTITVPFAVADGVTLTVDTDPWGPTATLSTGTDVTGDISDLGFAPIPRGRTILVLELDGTGSVGMSFRPNYRRAW